MSKGNCARRGYKVNCPNDKTFNYGNKMCDQCCDYMGTTNPKHNPKKQNRYTNIYPMPLYAIYRIFDVNNVLLYIGETTTGGVRIKEHFKDKTYRGTLFYQVPLEIRKNWTYDYIMDCTGMTKKERLHFEAGFIKWDNPYCNEDRPDTNLTLEDIELIKLETKNGITNA